MTNYYGGLRGLESAINSFDEEHPIKLPPNSHYNLKKWKVKVSVNDAGNEYRFTFTNDSGGYYTAEPWYIEMGAGENEQGKFTRTRNGANFTYKVIPKTHIVVGSLPSMRLISRHIKLNTSNTEPVEVVPLGPHHHKPDIEDSILKRIAKKYSKQTSINIGNKKRIFGKGRMKPTFNYDASKIRNEFIRHAKDSIMDYFIWMNYTNNDDRIFERYY